MSTHVWEGISHVLLDIEGTTCPISYVAETLFPYASNNLAPYLEAHQGEATIQDLMREVETAWQQDTDQEARELLSQYNQSGANLIPGVLPYLMLLIRRDRKVTALKDLQGKIWAEGYAKGELVGPLYADVPTALKQWHHQGLALAVYSSGSIMAQQLIYQHSNHGDLRFLFSHWFDTHTGSKQDPSSYSLIAHAMGCEPQSILFISDSETELHAASQANLEVVCSERDTIQPIANRIYPVIQEFHQINLNGHRSMAD